MLANEPELPIGTVELSDASTSRGPLNYVTSKYSYVRDDAAAIAFPLLGDNSQSRPTSPRQLEVRQCSFGLASELNALWHSRLPNIYAGAAGSRYVECYLAEYALHWYAAAIWTSPIGLNRMKVNSPDEVIELRRLAISPPAPRNTASWMLGTMSRELFARHPALQRLISYQDTAVHKGTIYKAANWRPVVTTDRYKTWNTNRPDRTNRAKTQADGIKIRWELHR